MKILQYLKMKINTTMNYLIRNEFIYIFIYFIYIIQYIIQLKAISYLIQNQTKITLIIKIITSIAIKIVII